MLRHVSLTQLLRDLSLHVLDQLLVKLLPRRHEQEEQHRLVVVVWSSLAHADAVLYLWEVLLDHVVDLGGAKAYTGWVQDAVCAAKEEDLLCCGVDTDEIAVGPGVVEAGEVGVVVLLCAVGAPEEDGLVGERDWPGW